LKIIEESMVKENPWLIHLKKVKKDNPELSFKEAMKKAKISYVKKK